MTDLGGTAERRVMLTGFLDWYRGVAVHKLDGLSRDEAVRIPTPTGLTLLGTVQHLTWDERIWFGHYLLGGPHDPRDVDESFAIAGDATVESVVTEYEATCARSREIVAAAPLDQRATIDHRVFGAVTLEWIILHMIEETARHAGHMDVLRELTDGRTGA
jgi:uncharacterized damage-inducible protein DinB